MPVLRYLLLSILVLPIVEIAIFIKVGQTIGLLPTLALVIAAAILGGLVLRQQGISVLMRLRNLGRGEVPTKTIADAMMLGIAAVLLALPGFFTDILALLLLLPPVRAWLYRSMLGRVNVVHARTSHGPAQDPRLRRPGVVDLDDDEFRPRG